MTNRHSAQAGFGRVPIRAVAMALPVAVAVGFAGSALADPAQPGTTAPPSQPGATAPAQPGTTTAPPAPAPAQPGVAVAPPNSPQVEDDQAAPTTDYGQSRPVPAPRYAAPINPGRLHAPRPVRPVAPITPPPNTIRIGEFQTPAPGWLPPAVKDGINNAASQAEANVSTFARSVGIAPNRSDRIAGTAALGALAGGALAGVPAAVPGAVAGAVIGGCIGGVIGLVAGAGATLSVIGAPFLLAGPLIGTVAGVAIGGVIGAAVTGVPGAAAGALAGGALGGAIGSGT